jgi:hypothetical protein
MDFGQNIVAIVLFGNLVLLLNGFIAACNKVMIEKVAAWWIVRYSVWVLLIELVWCCIHLVVIFGLQCFAVSNLLKLL